MEPRTQYAQTEDGVSIAYWTVGEGMPFVEMPFALAGNVQRLSPELRGWYGHLARKRKLVRYDGRGTGLSQRDVTDFSLDSLVLDLKSVADRLELERFALFAPMYSGPVAIAYAARYPEQVSHLILWHAWARTRDAASPQLRALGRLLDTDWETYTETAAHVALGWSEGEQARVSAAMYRESMTQAATQAFMRAMREVDVTDLLPQVQAPTLVLHRRQIPWLQVDLARDLASRIPDACLVVLEGTSPPHDLGDVEAVLEAIDDFLAEGEEAEGEEPAATTLSGLVTILFTDIESSTALRRKLGDAKVQELVRAHNEIVRAALSEHDGREIKHTGDGIMASFSTATSALQCSIAIQQGVATHVEEHPDVPLGVYVGLNAGEPIAEEQDLFGTSVDLARRICDHAEPGQILASNVVRELSEGKGFLFGDIGDVVPKGFEEPVRLYEVRWREGHR